MDSSPKFMGYAFLIGIGKFPHLIDYDALPGLVKEAQQLETRLQNRGYEDINIWGQSLQDPTNEQIIDELKGFKFAIGQNPQAAIDGTAFIYLATHGHIQEEGPNHENNYYLLTTNSKYLNETKDKIDPSSCILDQTLFDICLTIPVKNLVLLLNTCFSGAVGSRAEMRARIADYFKERGSLAIIASSTQDQASWYHRVEETSLFGRYLLRGLELGMVEIHQLRSYIVGNIKREYIEGKDQTPFSIIGIEGDFNVALPDPDPEIKLILLGDRPHFAYYSRPEVDQQLTDCLMTRKHILLTGPSLSGKSRAVYHALMELKLVSDVLIPSTLEPWRLGDSTEMEPKLMVLDDLHRLVKEPNFDPFLQTALTNKHTIVATCRSGTDYQNVDRYFWDNLNKDLKTLFGDNIIPMPQVSKEVAETIAKDTGYQWVEVQRNFDGNIGSIFLPLREMAQRFTECSAIERTLLRGLRKLYLCGIYEERVIFPLKWLKPVVHEDELNLKKYEWTNWLEQLQEKEFLNIEPKDRIRVEEVYLERIVQPEVDIPELILFQEIISTFSAVKKPEPLFRVGFRAYKLGMVIEEKIPYMQRAVEAFEQALQLDPTLIEAWNNKGTALSALGQHEEALVAYEQALELNQKLISGWNNKGNALIDLKRHEEALVAYEQALELDPTYVITLFNKGNALKGLGQHDEALETYEKALELDPKHIDAWNNKGGALRSLGRHEEALVACVQALELDPTYVKAWNNKGVALRSLGRHEEALVACAQALELDPTYIQAWNNKGITLRNLERHDEALVAYDHALELDPTDIRVWNHKGGTLTDLRQHVEALVAYDHALELDPTYARAWYNKGITLSGLGKHDEALEAYEKALELDPTDFTAWNNKGAALRSLGWFDEALMAYDEALELDPTYVWAWYNKGNVLSQLGRHQEAEQAYQRAKELNKSQTDQTE